MAKKQHHEEHENHERWLVSYADFITLLFAFFVVLYSVSRVDNKRMVQVVSAIKFAMHFKGTGGVDKLPMFEGPPSEGGCVANVGSDKKNSKPDSRPQIENLRRRLEKRLREFLAKQKDNKEVQFQIEGKRLIIRLSASRFFDPSQAAIRPEVLPVLDAIAGELVETKKNIRIEGHTDDSPIGSSRYRDNWELSAARAAAVASYIQRAFKINGRLLVAAGYGSNRPLVANDSPAGREANRRVEMAIELGDADKLMEPGDLEMSHLTEAAEKLEKGNRHDALRLLSMARLSAPRTCLALGEIAVLYQRAGEMTTAERVFCEALEAPQDESTYYALLSLGGMLRQQKRSREATQVFKNARQVARTLDQATAAARASIDAAVDARDYPSAIEDLLYLQRQPEADNATIQAALHTLYATEFHKWYYDSRVWQQTTYHGVGCYKFPADMWNYQEILTELAPSLVIEFGTLFGGATLFYADTMTALGKPFKVLTADVNHDRVPARVRQHPNIEFLTGSSADPRVARRITELRAEYPGKVFAIVDSDHSRAHVAAELELLRPVLTTGDYLIVEDTNLNGHPVRADFGPGPYEALEEYVARYPDDYALDERRERKFGFTAATRGFLIRR